MRPLTDELEKWAKERALLLPSELGWVAYQVLILIGELRKLRAVADAAENHRVWMDAETKPGRSFFPELKAALAALDATDAPEGVR